ncbi:hypothetical protein P5G51_001745 [Virgibacillus sp. 179-BFC.A HS]|uniref:Uncharacterized protein n=1 Tax=Tigheibacillus jepli TaxID=3035914 RepID=A0ABU5CE78_9BACI|nr:hypothetical protein [Virgibacillus sp. 179-BFC.A HS]MDY0404306.1 hypothetical protein [Virgibacillus sp. 179-BFC.A HS]
MIAKIKETMQQRVQRPTMCMAMHILGKEEKKHGRRMPRNGRRDNRGHPYTNTKAVFDTKCITKLGITCSVAKRATATHSLSSTCIIPLQNNSSPSYKNKLKKDRRHQWNLRWQPFRSAEEFSPLTTLPCPRLGLIRNYLK